MNEIKPPQWTYYGLYASLCALLVLGVAWELVLAPLRPGGSMMVLKVIPLLFVLRGVIKRDLYTLQWSSMLILLYFTEGVVRATSDHGRSALLGGIETGLVVMYFTCVLMYLRPYKQAAKRLAREAIQKASQ